MNPQRRLLALRVAARLLDLLLVAAPVVCGAFWVEAINASSNDSGFEGLGRFIIYLGLSVVWVLVCWPLYEAVGYRTGATTGMRLAGLRIQHVHRVSPTLGMALIRGVLLAWPISMGLYLYAVPSVLFSGWLAWDAWHRPDGRHWVDRVTGSVVLPRDAQVFDRTR